MRKWNIISNFITARSIHVWRSAALGRLTASCHLIRWKLRSWDSETDRETRRESLITAAAALTEDRHRHGACQALVSQSIHTWQLLQQLDSSFPAVYSSHHAPHTHFCILIDQKVLINSLKQQLGIVESLPLAVRRWYASSHEQLLQTLSISLCYKLIFVSFVRTLIWSWRFWGLPMVYVWI